MKNDSLTVKYGGITGPLHW